MVVLFIAMYKSYVPALQSVFEIEKIADSFNADINPNSIIYNTITITDIDSAIKKFKNADKDIFTDTKVDFKKILGLNNSENKEINLNLKEYAFVLNALKNNDQLLANRNIELMLRKTNFIGINKTQYYTKILVKIDLSEILNYLGDFKIIENNLYLSITKNYNNVYTYHINDLNNEENQIMCSFFDGLIKYMEGFYDYNLESLSKKIYDEYERLYTEFEKCINITTNLI